MRWWGAAFCVVAAGLVVLPDPLGRLLLAVTIAAGVIALTIEWVDKQEQVRQAPDTARQLEHIAELRRMTAEDDELSAEWNAFLGNVPTEHRPLIESLPMRLRKVSGRVPRQRTPGGQS